jgi:uncharacterized protein YbaR (Trm112 family)
MLDKELLEILVCPKCKGELAYESEKDQLICSNCRLVYHIKNDIPVMLIDQAENF